MLRLVLSRALGGKTTYIHNIIADLLKSEYGGEIILMVPEQYSFATERMMLEKLGPQDANRVEVLSFTRLANTVFNSIGWDKGRRIDECGKILLMGRALKACQDKLEIYSKSVESPSVVKEMLALAEEFNQCAITKEVLGEALNRMPDGLLKSKIKDISLVLSLYDTFIDDGYFDDSNLLTVLANKLSSSDFFKGKTVFIDAFRGFTAQEIDVISAIMPKADDVYVTITAPDLEDKGTDDIFYHTKKTAKKLKKAAALENVAVAKPIILNENYVGRNEAMSFFENNFLSPSAKETDAEASNITVCAAPDMRSECAYIASTIKRMLRTNEYKSKDIAVIMRDEGAYDENIKSALIKCGVPIFEDKRQPIINQPLITLVRGALKIAESGFDTDSVLRVLKTELCSLDTGEVAELENYTYLWQINGSRWNEEWKSNPDGFAEEAYEQDEKLKRLNELRIRAVAPFNKFRNKMKDTTGKKACENVFNLLEDLNSGECLKNLAINLEDDGETALALETERLWNTLCELLDTAAVTLGDTAITAHQFASLFDLMLSTCTLGEIPQGLNEVTVGGAQRIRPVSPKVVFIMGANAGVFPKAPSQGGILNVRDRMSLMDLGVETATFGEESVAEERFIAYSACCCASEKLYVSYTSKGADGSEMIESEIVSFIKDKIKNANRVDTMSIDKLDLIEGKAPAFEITASLMHEGGKLYNSLKEYFSKDEDYSGKLNALFKSAGQREFKIESQETAKKLFGEHMYMSPSRAESFYRCPFAYFCRYGVDLKERKIASFDPLQKGTVIHLVLEKLLVKYTPQELSEKNKDEILKEIREIMDGYLSKYLDADSRSERFIYLYDRLSLSVEEVVERLISEFMNSDFVPADMELELSRDGEIAPYYLKLPDGGSVCFNGKVDRVDTAMIEDKKFVRVVDYKSSGKPFAVSDVLQGLNMQMLIYLFTIIKNGEKKYGKTTPAGVLYMPAKAPSLTIDRGQENEIQETKNKKCKMQGVLLENPSVVYAMEHDGNGVFVPAKINKKGEIKGSVIALDELNKLWNRVDELLIEMGTELHLGKIGAVPAQGKNYDKICSYCEYWDVCNREKDMPLRELDDNKQIGGEE